MIVQQLLNGLIVGGVYALFAIGFTLVFGMGAALCAVAGSLLGPLLAVQVGMGENILILAFVVIVIGGIGGRLLVVMMLLLQ